METIAFHLEAIPRNFARRDRATQDFLTKEAFARAQHMRSYKIWLYSPLPTTRRDLTEELTRALGHMIRGEWLELPSSPVDETPRSLREKVRPWLIQTIAVVTFAGLLYAGTKLAVPAHILMPVVAIVEWKLLQIAGLQLSDLSKTMDLLSARPH